MSAEFKPASKRRKIVVLSFLLGIVPVGLLFFKLFDNHYTTLPYYGQHEVNAPGDTTFFQVPPFSFTDQDGHTITDETVNGKILVVDFFFTSCKSICPIMTKRLSGLQVNLPLHDKAYKDVLFLSHTVDPEHDTPQVLKEYARQNQADTARWKFLTGDASTIYRQGNLGYLLSALVDSASAEQFVHSPNFVLVDKRRHIRGVYDGTTSQGVNDLVQDIKLLIGEERRRDRLSSQP